MRLVWHREKFSVEWFDRQGTRHRTSTGTDDPEDAGRFLREFKKLTDEQEVRKFAQLWDEYREYVKGRPAWTTMGHEWKSLEPWIAHLRPDELTPVRINAYTEVRLKMGRSAGTIRTELNRVRRVLSYAVQHRHLEKAPYIPMPEAPMPRDKFLTRDQARRLLEDQKMPPYVRVFVILAMHTLGRAEAILDLTWDRVDLNKGLVNLADPLKARTKKGRAIVPIGDAAVLSLLEARTRATSNFVVEYAGGRVGSVKRGILAAGKRIGLTWTLTPHVFRHSGARFMAESGVPMSEIATFLGHSSTRITEKVYARFSPDYLRKAAKALEV